MGQGGTTQSTKYDIRCPALMSVFWGGGGEKCFSERFIMCQSLRLCSVDGRGIKRKYVDFILLYRAQLVVKCKFVRTDALLLLSMPRHCSPNMCPLLLGSSSRMHLKVKLHNQNDNILRVLQRLKCV